MRFSSLPKNGQAVEFERTDSVVFMLNTIANNIAQRNANYLTTLQKLNVSTSISGFTNRLVNPFSQACFNFLCSLKPSHSTPSFFLFGIFGDKSTSPEAKQNRRNNPASLRHVFSHSGHWSRCRDAPPVTTENISFSPTFITRKL